MAYGSFKFLDQQGWGKFITVDGDTATARFKFQDGPIKEVGENGCQIDDMIYMAAVILRNFNSRFPCRENSCAITKLDEALMWLRARTEDRQKRGVEGKDKE